MKDRRFTGIHIEQGCKLRRIRVAPDTGAKGKAQYSAMWLDEASYHQHLRFDRATWAWEWLQRNPAFARDVVHLQKSSRLGAVDTESWGALFRGGSLLASRNQSICPARRSTTCLILR